MTTRRSPSIWFLRGLVYSIGVFLAAAVVLWALESANSYLGYNPAVNDPYDLYFSPFAVWAIISSLLVLLATALAGAVALRHSLALGRVRWARAFAILLVVSLLAPLMYLLTDFGHIPLLGTGMEEAVVTIASALGFLLLAILALVYAHPREPASRAPRQPADRA